MIAPDDPRHGTTRGYHAGCHEACCRRAMARYEKAGRLARLNGGRAVPALGAQRRLQALMRLGWSSNAIAEAAGLTHRNHVWRILHGQKGKPTTWIQRETDAWVRDVYGRLSMRVPDGGYAARTRAHAERMGWPPPLCWDDIDNDPAPIVAADDRQADPVVIDRIMAGDFTLARAANHAERVEVVRRWRAAGWSLAGLDRLTGWRTHRYTSSEGEAA